MQSLSRTAWSRKALPMVCSTRQDRSTKRTPPRLERVEARKSTPKANILQVFTIDFSEIQFIVSHNSQSDGQNKSAKSGMNLRKKTIHTNALQKKRRRGQWHLTLNKASRKRAHEASTWSQSRCHDEKSLTPRIRRTNWRAHPSKSTKTTCPALELINIQDSDIGLQLQVPRGDAHPNGVGSELTEFFHFTQISLSFFFVTVGSVNSRQWSTVTDGRSGQNTLTPRIFWHICTHSILVHMHRMAQGVARRVFIKERSSTCHHVSDRSLSLLSFLHLLCPGDHPPCGRNRRVLNTHAHPQNEKYCPVTIQNPLTQWPPFCSSPCPIATLATFRASPILCPLLRLHPEFSSLEASAKNLCTKLWWRSWIEPFLRDVILVIFWEE